MESNVIKTLQGKYGTIRLLKPSQPTTQDDINDLIRTLTRISINAYVSGKTI